LDGQLLDDIQRLLPTPLEQVFVEGFEKMNAPPRESQREWNPVRSRRRRFPTPSPHMTHRQMHHHVK
jgi:hypothetical protein